MKSTYPEFTEQELAAIREEYAKGSTDSQFTLFISECRQRHLIPGVHVVFQLRAASEYDASSGAWFKTLRATKITTINALRLLAVRTKEYVGQQEPIYVYLDDNMQPTQTSVGVPLAIDDVTPRIPWAAKVGVHRSGFKEPLVATARFDAYAVTKKDGKLTDIWNRRGPEQLAKCAEALALRMAFPEELADLYISEEFKPEPEDTPPPAAPATVAPPAPVSAPPVDHTPAQPKDEPRPGEEKQEVVQPLDSSPAEAAKPTAEQQRAYGKRIDKTGAERNLAKAWLMAKFDVKLLKSLTIEQWEAGVAQIEAAGKSGPEAIKTLLIGKEQQPNG